MWKKTFKAVVKLVEDRFKLDQLRIKKTFTYKEYGRMGDLVAKFNRDGVVTYVLQEGIEVKRWSDWYQLPLSDYEEQMDSSPNKPLSYEDDEEVEAMRRETKALDEQLRKIDQVLYDQELILMGLHRPNKC